MSWKQPVKKLPKLNVMGDSKHLLCIERGSNVPFVGFYNADRNKWYVSEHSSNSISRDVMWWHKLPKKPF